MKLTLVVLGSRTLAVTGTSLSRRLSGVRRRRRRRSACALHNSSSNSSRRGRMKMAGPRMPALATGSGSGRMRAAMRSGRRSGRISIPTARRRSPSGGRRVAAVARWKWIRRRGGWCAIRVLLGLRGVKTPAKGEASLLVLDTESMELHCTLAGAKRPSAKERHGEEEADGYKGIVRPQVSAHSTLGSEAFYRWTRPREAQTTVVLYLLPAARQACRGRDFEGMHRSTAASVGNQPTIQSTSSQPLDLVDPTIVPGISSYT